MNAVGEGARSNERSATPVAPATVPGAPTLNSATAGNGSVALSWSAPVRTAARAITGYKVYRGTSSGGETLLTTLGTVTSWTDTAVANGTTYYYQVSAVNAVGEGAPLERALRHAGRTAPCPARRRSTRRPPATAASRSPGARPLERRLRDHRLQGLPRHRERRRDAARRRSAPSPAGPTPASPTARPTTTRSAPSTPSARARARTSAPRPRPRRRPRPARRAELGDAPATAASRSPGARRLRRRLARSPATRSTAARRAAARPCSTTLGNVTSWTDTGARQRHDLLLPGQRRERRRRGPRSNERSATPPRRDRAGRADAELGDRAATAASRSPGARRRPTAARRSPATRSTAAPSSGGETLLTHARQRHQLHRHERLTNGTTYYYQVTAVNAVGEGARSNERSATPAAPATAPGAPTLNSATAGNGSVALAWSAPASNGGAAITGYKVYRGTRAAARRCSTTLGNGDRLHRHAASPTARPTTTRSPPSTPSAKARRSNERSATPPRPRRRPARRRSTRRRPATAASPSPGARPLDGGSAITGYKRLPRHRRAAARRCSRRSAPPRAAPTRSARERHDLLLPGQRRQRRRRGLALDERSRDAAPDGARRADAELGDRRQRQRRARLERARVERRLGDHRLQGLPRHRERRRDALDHARQRHELHRHRRSPTGRPTTTRSAP